MMKMKRFVSMVLVLVFVLSFAASASAADIAWESDGVSYSANVVCTSEGGDVALFTSTTMYHWRNDYNMSTIITPSSNYSITRSMTWSPEPDNQRKLETALFHEGYVPSATFNISTNTRVEIPGAAETGEYMIGAFYFTGDGRWSVFDLSSDPNTVVEDGYFYNALLITEYYIDYYKVG